MRKIELAYVTAIVTLSFTTPAHAYIDPGTGTLIVQSIIGGAAAALTVASVYITKIRSFVSRLVRRENSEDRTGRRK